MSISLEKRGLDSSEYIELIKIFTLALEKHKRNNKGRNPYHVEGIGNIIYEDVWINILSKLL